MHLRIYSKDSTYNCAEIPCTNFRYFAYEEYFGSPLWFWRLDNKKMVEWQWIIIKYAVARWRKSLRIHSWLKNVSLIIPARKSHFPTHRRELKFSVVSTTKYWRDNVFGRAGIGGLCGRKWRHTRTVPRAAGNINNRRYAKSRHDVVSWCDRLCYQQDDTCLRRYHVNFTVRS